MSPLYQWLEFNLCWLLNREWQAQKEKETWIILKGKQVQLSMAVMALTPYTMKPKKKNVSTIHK
jgi:hypothetical protein